MIGKRYSAKHKRHLWGFDVYLGDGSSRRRVRTYQFETKKLAEEVLDALRSKEREERFGLAPLINRPVLADLIEKRIPMISAKAERTRAKRILYTWLSLIDPRIRVDEIKTPTIRAYVERRQADGRPPSSINRELATIDATLNPAGELFAELEHGEAQRRLPSSSNRELATIAATLNQAGEIFAELEQWKPPKIPRLKVIKSRRERLLLVHEYIEIVPHLP